MANKKTVSLTIDENILDTLRQWAGDEERTLSNMVQMALRQWINNADNHQ